MDRQQKNVDRFLKLGYSYGDILRVLGSLRYDAQTNDILEVLIKTCRSTSRSSQAARPGHSSPLQLVPRGCSPPLQTQTSLIGPEEERESGGSFRPIVIDGSNVAMSHGNKQVFSCRGVQLAVKWFWERGHRDITVFVPLWRKEQTRPEAPITDQHILHELERRKILVFTPSRCVNGKRVVCYDDRYIVKLACDSDGIIVSNDNYRDLQIEKPQWKKFIEERLLMYTFANDKFMPPDDPLGRNGPTIDNFLRKNPKVPVHKRQHCPYGKKCTYGVKCKFYHPERNQSQLSVADELREKNKLALDRDQSTEGRSCSPLQGSPPFTPTSATATLYEHGQSNHSHCSFSPTTTLLCQEAPPSRLSPSEQLESSRETVSPGSLETSLSRVYIQDPGCSPQASYSSNSGVMGPNHSHRDEDHCFSSALSSCSHRPGSGSAVPECCCTPYMQQNISLEAMKDSDSSASSQRMYCHQHARRSYSVTAQGRDVVQCKEEHHLHHPVQQNAFSSDIYPHIHRWIPDRQAAGLSVSGPSDLLSEQRRSVRTKLSTIFPQPTVDHVMGLHPHTLDTSELIPLIHNFRTGYVRF
ncbi:hypothetical protein AGOR_G00083370 [Albula goreensis]|uniref:RNase NYN domain-containing protein n=1 Tax=Albula goreensis TaxID=1534307 RepID=A0A8T3DN76_9TELE|nr:hypothetical protein AGOR_G00083370 [Albula goreensis]